MELCLRDHRIVVPCVGIRLGRDPAAGSVVRNIRAAGGRGTVPGNRAAGRGRSTGRRRAAGGVRRKIGI